MGTIHWVHLASRIQRRVRHLSAHARYRLGFSEPDPGGAHLSTSFRHPIPSNERLLLVSVYQALFPDAAETELAEARRLAAHRFTFLGHPIDHGDRIAWSLDPVSGREWSRGFSADIPYRGPERLGDIKLPWELNKHQYFFTLGKAGWLTDDPAFPLEIIRQIDHWIEENPYRRGINWISALEVGTRAVSWIMAYPFYAAHGDARFQERLARSLAQHMIFVDEHLSTGPFANNHLIGDAAALVAGGLFLEHRQGGRWLETGLAHLEAEMHRQVTSDGVHAERSVAYHRFVLDQYHLVGALLAANGRSLSAATTQGMERMTEFIMDVLRPDGSAPSFGDGDDARGLWFRADCPADFRSLLALGAVSFGRDDFKMIARGLTEEVLWLFGNDGVEQFHRLPASLPDHTSAAYPEGGYYVMRDGWEASCSALVFDCGPLGHGAAGHGHADALSFQLYTSGYPFLVDPGAFSYNLDYEWRDAFRSTKAHNTIVVDGVDQSSPADRMSWRTMAASHMRRWLSTNWFDVADGEHDGYRRLSDPVTHRRVVVYLKPDLWVIQDELSGTGRHDIELLMHLRPDCDVDGAQEPPVVVLTSARGSRLRIWMLDGGRTARLPDVVVGTEQERSAWFSAAYGTRVPSRALSFRRELAGRCTLITCLSTSNQVSPAFVDEHGVLGFSVRRAASVEDTLRYRMDGEVHFERRTGGVPTVVWAGRFRELSIDGLVDVRAPTVIDRLVFDKNRCDVTLDADGASLLHVTARDGVTVAVNGRPYRRR